MGVFLVDVDDEDDPRVVAAVSDVLEKHGYDPVGHLWRQAPTWARSAVWRDVADDLRGLVAKYEQRAEKWAEAEKASCGG